MRRSRASSLIPPSTVGLAGQARGIALLKAVQLTGMMVFTIVAPRMMGPDLFGRFAVILSVNTLWMTTSALGARYVFGRFVPEYLSQERPDRVREVFLHVVLARGITLAMALPLLWVFFGRVLPGVSTFTIWAAMAAFVAMVAASPMFGLFFGLNRLALSMSREATSRLVLLALVLLLGGFMSLERASLALVLTHGLYFALAAYLLRPFFPGPRVEFDAARFLMHIRFGVTVFAANFLLRLPWRLGETTLAIAKAGNAEIAYFNVALSATMAFSRVLASLTTLLIPTLSAKQHSGDLEERDEKLGLALKYLSVAASLYVLSIVAVGRWAVEVVLGPGYAKVFPNLTVVSLAVIAIPWIRIAIALAVVRDRVMRNLQLGAVALPVFAFAAAALVPQYASTGMSAALALAIGSAGIWALFQMRTTGVLAVAHVGRHLGVQGAAASLVVLLGYRAEVGVLALGLYAALLLGGRIVTPHELKMLLAEFRRPSPS